jgi:hypothetical protein
MKGLLIGLVLVAGLAYGGAKAYLHYHVSDSVDAVFKGMNMAMQDTAEIEYGGISSTLTGELTIDDVKFQLKGFSDNIVIGRLGLNTPHFLALLNLSSLSAGSEPAFGGPPEYIGIFAEDIKVSAAADYYRDIYTKGIEQLAPADIRQRGVQCVGKYGFSPRTLAALGYDELIMSTSVTLRQADTHFITEMDFGVVDMVDVDIEASIAGDLMSGAAMGASYQPRLRSLQIEITDQSLNKRVEKYCTELGLTPEQILRAHLNALQYFGKKNGIEFDKYVIDPYKEYLAGKSRFIVTAKPRKPLDLARIKKYKPIDVPALLNLEAAAR